MTFEHADMVTELRRAAAAEDLATVPGRVRQPNVRLDRAILEMKK
ncbi:hypothetical protein [Mesorhizobium sp. M0514]